MELGIRGRHALVVGASRGIGRAAAVALAAEGVAVTTVALSQDDLEQLVEEMGGSARGHHWLAADLMGSDPPADIAAALLRDRGPFDIVVHAVGGPLEIRDPVAPVEDWQRVLQFNAGIAIAMNHVLLPPMIAKAWGRVVHVSSISAVMLRGAAAYACAKSYLNAYTTTVGRALAGTGVVLSAVLPGAVSFPGSYWDMQIRDGNPRVQDFLRHHQAVGRMGTPAEIAPFILLLSSELASFAQASLVAVDGGNM